MTKHELKPVQTNNGRDYVCMDCERVWPHEVVNRKDPKCPKLTGIPCNQCGTDILSEYGTLSQGFSTIVTGGYDGPHLFDNTQYRFRICEPCLVNLFRGFTVPVDVREYTLDEDWHAADPDGKDWQ